MVSQVRIDYINALAADRATKGLDENDHLKAVELMEAVADVTDADLEDVDLEGVPLEGVRCSSTTRWPPAWRDRVWNNSPRIGPDLWMIGPWTQGMDHYVMTS
ncbi:hypothetical protein LV78_005277 [Actinosynnema pretiosum]|nr:hypothetical protein [Actinosynnema pretiosum]